MLIFIMFNLLNSAFIKIIRTKFISIILKKYIGDKSLRYNKINKSRRVTQKQSTYLTLFNKIFYIFKYYFSC